MPKCCFCRDDLENHCNNLQHPGGVDRWLCGTCITWANTTRYLQEQAELKRQIDASLAECERHAEELATGIEGGSRHRGKVKAVRKPNYLKEALRALTGKRYPGRLPDYEANDVTMDVTMTHAELAKLSMIEAAELIVSGAVENANIPGEKR